MSLVVDVSVVELLHEMLKIASEAMMKIYFICIFFVLSNRISIWLLLRRTLVRFVRYSANKISFFGHLTILTYRETNTVFYCP